MNKEKMKQRKQEPEQLFVTLVDQRGSRIELMNDGTLTTRYAEIGEDKNVLQTRAAFRGFVGTLTEVCDYKIDSAYGNWNEEGGEE